MRRTFYLASTLMALLISACSINQQSMVKPIDPITINNSQQLYANKLYEQALIAILEEDPEQLEDPAKRKLLWSINDRIVTVQWYLQKSFIALMEGRKDTALIHVDNALKLYPSHKPSLLFKKKLDAVNLKIESKSSKPVLEKEGIKKIKSKADLEMAKYYLTTGKTYFEHGQLSMAKKTWLHGLDIVPSHKALKENLISLITNQGLQLFGQGDITGSIEKWEEAIKLKPNDPEIKEYLDKARKAKEKISTIN